MIEERRLRLTMGALLHDIGKVVYRAAEEQTRHEISGRDFVAEGSMKLKEKEIMDCVRYHHARDMKNAELAQDALAYIVYMADNLAAATDRRKAGDESGQGKTFDRRMPLAPVFNRLNGNDGNWYYAPSKTNVERDINYPEEERHDFDASYYRDILRKIDDNLKGMECSEHYIQSLMDVLEANLSFVPSSTNEQELPDISLYDHLKLTAAFAGCIHAYLEAGEERDYRRVLFQEGTKFYQEKAFLFAILDLSGVQSFLYTITTKKALKNLRARSFYLDILMEHLADELLEDLGLTRANLLYSGGGNCKLLLPNTEQTKQKFSDFLHRANQWFLEHFDISLYLAGSYEECSGDHLKDVPEGSYPSLHIHLAQKLSDHKAGRYTAEEILQLNQKTAENTVRECKVCRRAGAVDEDDCCPICAALQQFSAHILNDAFFMTVRGEMMEGLPLPGGYSLIGGNREKVLELQKANMAKRIYGKNRFYTGKGLATKLWVGDYHAEDEFKELAEKSEGIQRLGILRADVDDLGQTFAAGFASEKYGNRYMTLSRTAALSRQLSMFFKLHIRKLLERPAYILSDKNKEQRHAAIVYSGGDDLFIVGAWDDVLELSIDLRRALERYTEGTLTISAGIGVYPENYPVSAMAEETARLEEASKGLSGKSAVTLFDESGSETYHWKELEEGVFGEKYREISEFFADTEERGKNFLYRILLLLRGREKKINFARYVYLLSRMEPDHRSSTEQQARYRAFASRMLQWIQRDEDARQLATAIQIYVYLTREKGGTEDGHENHNQ